MIKPITDICNCKDIGTKHLSSFRSREFWISGKVKGYMTKRKAIAPFHAMANSASKNRNVTNINTKKEILLNHFAVALIMFVQ